MQQAADLDVAVDVGGDLETVGDEDREMGDPAAVARQGVVQRVDQSQRAAAQAELVHQALASGPTPAA